MNVLDFELLHSYKFPVMNTLYYFIFELTMVASHLI